LLSGYRTAAGGDSTRSGETGNNDGMSDRDDYFLTISRRDRFGELLGAAMGGFLLGSFTALVLVPFLEHLFR
jgi:hypothetical protein